ncbi:MAG: hypothetical protein IAF94_13110 [Pirellulaceae bacterium]|nr:hypothetical protein [Pirellulaceae bacterium]
MTEQEHVRNELLMNVPNCAADNPTCGEVGGAKPARGLGASTDGAMICDESDGGFCTARPSTESADASALQTLLESLTEGKFLCGGRPPKLTLGLKKTACMLLCLGISRRQAASILDIDHATITHAAQSDPDFGRALERAEEFSQLGPKIALAAAGMRDWRAAAWLLSHQKKHPSRLTSEERAANHQRDVEMTRYSSELSKLSDVLEEERTAAREQRDQARKQQRQAEKQARFEAGNPQLFRRKKKRDQQADVTEQAGEASVGHG